MSRKRPPLPSFYCAWALARSTSQLDLRPRRVTTTYFVILVFYSTVLGVCLWVNESFGPKVQKNGRLSLHAPAFLPALVWRNQLASNSFMLICPSTLPGICLWANKPVTAEVCNGGLHLFHAHVSQKCFVCMKLIHFLVFKKIVCYKSEKKNYPYLVPTSWQTWRQYALALWAL